VAAITLLVVAVVVFLIARHRQQELAGSVVVQLVVEKT
jgi:hypothetical protein